ncbi:hypothetical protein [Caulobacter sp. 17J65-9]|uniref:hypothetical protein n=1 Tax=Caulobacter sp. 17J65-9 TaxID=2709382 RepID=UPI0013C77E36|nr:hypothetical protein [Caulobacter sp. 17J65-9]NEX94862.1 hypothetical protein [Caulobacter sp. 17J65-9]
MIAPLAALLLASAPAAAPPAGSACFWVEGRLSITNGTPSVRIWPTGTKRLLGVVTASGEAEGAGLLPAEVERLHPDFDRFVWGRFHVCPLTEDRPGWTRRVTLVGAERLRAVAR